MKSASSLLALALPALLAATPARAWWNDDWTSRKSITIDTSAAGVSIAEPIGPQAVLVRLHAGNFAFDAARDDGADLRFVAGDDATPLAHHLEKYDPLLGEALVWVGVPDVQPGARTALWLYHGNPNATPADDAKGTYDPGTALVYHFAERGQAPRDSSTWGHHAVAAVLPAVADGALIGNGLRLDGKAPALTIPATPALAWAAGAKATWSAWLKPAKADASGIVFSRRSGADGFTVGFEGGKPFVEIVARAGGGRVVAPAAVAPGSWHHVAVTAGERIAVYVDGAKVAALDAQLPAIDGPSLVGGEATPPAAPAGAVRGARAATTGSRPGFEGELDELQLSSVERTAGAIRAAAVAQGSDPGELIVTGEAEGGGGGGHGYFAILIGAVTLDGWIVIGVLAVMAVVSWFVTISKAGYLSAAERSNERFTERFRQLGAELVPQLSSTDGPLLGDEKPLRDSPLYRIFEIGIEEARRRTRSGRPLTAETIEAIRASVDAGLVRENQRMSKGMVLLTIAISGGPFLGLLGTVVGVMITFAAIAAAGDVNVNAIAPGIAAALVATVAGLAVAIPALFAYNWLLTRIKNVTATLQVFVDELVTKLAEAWQDRSQPDARGARHKIVVSE